MRFLRPKSRWEGVDVLDLIPEQAIGSNRAADAEQIVLQVPRFREPWLGPLIQRWLPEDRKYFRVPLEPRGTFLWETMNGQRSVRELVDLVLLQFPDDEEKIHERVSMYLINLYQNKFIRFINFS